MIAPHTGTEFLGGRVQLYAGDCIDVLATLPANSVDSVVCDPPYHLTSIVKRFKDGEPAHTKTAQDIAGRKTPIGRLAAGFMGKTWDGGDIAFQPSTWAAVLRVLKPGGYILAFASSRGFGRMSVAIEDAGFINHPMFGWIFGSGFPKATRIKAEGYDGFRYGGQASKPALEPVYMGQKPFSEATGTANILRWGTGAVNIDGCRVETADGYIENAVTQGINTAQTSYAPAVARRAFEPSKSGRWPANIIHDGSEEVIAAFPDTGAGGGPKDASRTPGSTWAIGAERSAVPGGPQYGDSGSVARFFYTAKADAEDRLGSRHPTVKPLDLMQYLVRYVTPPGGIVLDPFAGTGTTGEAAFREGMRAVLIEREPEYQADIARRMELADSPMKRAAAVRSKNGLLGADEVSIFDDDEVSASRVLGRRIYNHFARDGQSVRSGSSDEVGEEA